MNKSTIALLIIISLSFAFCTPKSEQAKKFFDSGKAKIYKSQFEEAIADFDMAIELQPELYEAYFFRGNAYLNKGDIEKAIEDYDKTIEIRSDYADAYVNRGNAKTYLYNDQSKGCEDWLIAEELGKPNLSDKTKWCK